MSLKHYLSVLVLFLLTNFGYSQSNYGEIRGKVTDKKTRSVLDYATVVVRKEGIMKASTSSDDNGDYYIKGIDPGEYDIEVTFVGYKKYQATGIKVTSGTITFWNIEMTVKSEEGEELGGVDIIRFKKKLVEEDGNKNTLTSKDILKLPQRGVGAIANTSSGTNSSGGGISFLGNRTDGTRLFIDGVPVIGNTAMPTVGQEQIDLIQSGVPAMFGDLTGGAINITTKGPSRRRSQYYEYVTSSLFDKWHYNTLELAYSGPLKIVNKGGGDKERVLFGYQISGHLEYQKDNSPTVLGSWTVKDDVLDNIKENPLTVNPSGGGFIPTSSFLTKDDLELQKARQNVPFYLGVVNAKFEYTPTKTSVLTLYGSASAQQSRGYSYTSSLLNYDEYSLATNQTYRTYLRYTQKIGYQSGDKREKDAKKPLVSDAFYSIRADYQTSIGKSQHNTHKDNIFDYGYVGKFTRYRAPVYEYKTEAQKYIINKDGKSDTVVRQGYYELTGFRDTMITYEPGTQNPLRSRYTENAYDYFKDNFGLRGALSDGMIATYNGILNGFGLPGTYSLWYNPGTLLSGYSKSQQERFSAYAIGEASINTGKKKENKHDIQFGMTYEQNILSSYGLSASSLWILMPQLANKHIANLDQVKQGDYILNSIHSFDDQGRFLDSVNYNIRVDADQQSNFDKNLRAKLIAQGRTDAYGNKITETSFIDVNSLSPSELSLNMFNADDLNNKNNQYVSYYGYDYLGNRTRKRFGINDFLLDKQNRSLGSFAPIYSAAWLQDKFAIKDMIFRVGVRIERYDANQPTLKDPYSLYPIKTVGEVSELNGLAVNHPDNIGDDYAIYVNNAKNPTKVLGYRKDNTWYDAQGVEVSNPEILAQQTASNIIQPYLFDANNKEIVKEAFKDYEPQVNVLPRVWFSFPINKEALFFANYDVLTQRPTDGATFTPVSSYYFLESDQSRFLPNAALKPRIKTMYELGYKQKLSNVSAISVIMSYSEVRNDFGQYRYNQAYPVSYTSYSNIDFSTNKAFRAEYQYRGLKNFQMSANYTLLFADGTGSNINAQSALIQANQPNLRSLYPLDVDFRHNFNTTFTYGYEGGKDYKGPIWFGKRVFENAEASFIVLARSGAPYTANLSPTATAMGALGTVTRSQIKGNPYGSRMPWQFKADVNISRSFEFKKKQVKEDRINVTGMTVFFWVQNLFNGKIVQNVYAFTGLPDDDGYLSSPEGQQKISQQVSQQSFIDLYNISVNNPFNYAAPRMMRLGVRFQL